MTYLGGTTTHSITCTPLAPFAFGNVQLKYLNMKLYFRIEKENQVSFHSI